MAQSGVAPKVVTLIRSCNRSVPCMEVISCAVQVLLNVAKVTPRLGTTRPLAVSPAGQTASARHWALGSHVKIYFCARAFGENGVWPVNVTVRRNTNFL